jgi:DNA-binding NarL/FixJ family response regulator
LVGRARTAVFIPAPVGSFAADGPTWQAEWNRLCGVSDQTLWKRAATAWDVLSRPHRAAYARRREAEAILAKPGGRPAVTAVLRTAARQAARHVPLSSAITDLARRARIDLPDTESATASHETATVRAFGLTDRELAVLRLLADGRSNPEIGAALFISTKTVSVHVTSILRKLDVATRVQAATVAERGLLTPDPVVPKPRSVDG